MNLLPSFLLVSIWKSPFNVATSIINHPHYSQRSVDGIVMSYFSRFLTFYDLVLPYHKPYLTQWNKPTSHRRPWHHRHPWAPELRGLRGIAGASIPARGVPSWSTGQRKATWLWLCQPQEMGRSFGGKNPQTSGHDEVYTTMISLFQLIHW